MFDAGNYLSLALLDTGHSHPIEGAQAAWLEESLKRRRHIPHIWAAYHISAYPSYYPYDGEGPMKIRTHWVPIFEKYRVSLAFEHHNHRFKKTYPIKGGVRNTRGIIYLGDGSWGVEPRPAAKDADRRWYLDRSESVNVCYFVTLSRSGVNIEARNLEGEVIDRLE
jgi:hypothetical protein